METLLVRHPPGLVATPLVHITPRVSVNPGRCSFQGLSRHTRGPDRPHCPTARPGPGHRLTSLQPCAPHPPARPIPRGPRLRLDDGPAGHGPHIPSDPLVPTRRPSSGCAGHACRGPLHTSGAPLPRLSSRLPPSHLSGSRWTLLDFPSKADTPFRAVSSVSLSPLLTVHLYPYGEHGCAWLCSPLCPGRLEWCLLCAST